MEAQLCVKPDAVVVLSVCRKGQKGLGMKFHFPSVVTPALERQSSYVLMSDIR